MSRWCSSDRMKTRFLGSTAWLRWRGDPDPKLPAERFYDKITWRAFAITRWNRYHGPFPASLFQRRRAWRQFQRRGEGARRHPTRLDQGGAAARSVIGLRALHAAAARR